MDPESSEEDLSLPPSPIISSLSTPSKPTAKIAYTYYPSSPSTPLHPNPFSTTLIVFLNGLALPRSSWDATLTLFLEKRCSAHLPYPSLLSYDRYGQGASDRDPEDLDPPPCHGHDVTSAVHSLHDILQTFWKKHLWTATGTPTPFPALIFVCNSLGCALARLWGAKYPGTLSALLFLDSIMANSDSVSFWPDPDTPGFDDNSLPPGISENDVRATRAAYAARFHPDVPSWEGLSRRTLASLLPSASAPQIEGYNGRGPYLTVVGHDWQEFADQTFTGPLHTPRILTMTYTNPTWRRYNEVLVFITEPERAIGPITAVGCGHFVMRDDPGFVADEVGALLDRVVNRVDQVREVDVREGERKVCCNE